MKVNLENSQLGNWPPTHVDSATKFISRGNPNDSESLELASGIVYIPNSRGTLYSCIQTVHLK